MSKKIKKIFYQQNGFTLLELMAALVIGTTVLVAVIGVYNQMQTSVQTIEKKLAGGGLGDEILQRIAEDIDKIVSPLVGQAADTSISIKNKNDGTYNSAQMIITRTYYDNKNEKKTFEQIIWQSSYDFDANSLVLYRSHSGVVDEDLLLDYEKEDWEKELFIPISSGLTCFSIEVPKGDQMLNSWTSASLPRGVVITISFEQPYMNDEGLWEIDDNDRIIRTIAIDRAKLMKFVYIPPGFDANDFNNLPFDANELNEIDNNDLDFTDADFNDGEFDDSDQTEEEPVEE